MGMALAVPRYTIEDLDRFPDDGNRYEHPAGAVGAGDAGVEISERPVRVLLPYPHVQVPEIQVVLVPQPLPHDRWRDRIP